MAGITDGIFIGEYALSFPHPSIEKLTPPDVAFSEIGLYVGTPVPESTRTEIEIIVVGSDWVEALPGVRCVPLLALVVTHCLT